MAEFQWVKTPQYGTCVTCGSSQSDRGFVDCFSSVNVKRGDATISGNVDVVMCGYCLEQAARLVGSATREETMEMTQSSIDKDQEIEKLKDEIASHQQRYFNLIDNLSEPKQKEVANG